VWLVWISSGVRIHTRAVLLMSPSEISFSALDGPWPMWVIGISGARLAWTSAGVRPMAVVAWAKAATAPHPMPIRKSVQKSLPLGGSPDR